MQVCIKLPYWKVVFGVRVQNIRVIPIPKEPVLLNSVENDKIYRALAEEKVTAREICPLFY